MTNEKACLYGHDNLAIRYQKRSAASYEIARMLLASGNIGGAIQWQLIAASEAQTARAYYENMVLVTL